MTTALRFSLTTAVRGRLIGWTMLGSRAVAAGTHSGRRYVLTVSLDGAEWQWSAQSEGRVVAAGTSGSSFDALGAAEMAYVSDVSARAVA